LGCALGRKINQRKRVRRNFYSNNSNNNCLCIYISNDNKIERGTI